MQTGPSNLVKRLDQLLRLSKHCHYIQTLTVGSWVNPAPATNKTLRTPLSSVMAVFCCYDAASSNIAARPPTSSTHGWPRFWPGVITILSINDLIISIASCWVFSSDMSLVRCLTRRLCSCLIFGWGSTFNNVGSCWIDCRTLSGPLRRYNTLVSGGYRADV